MIPRLPIFIPICTSMRRIRRLRQSVNKNKKLPLYWHLKKKYIEFEFVVDEGGVVLDGVIESVDRPAFSFQGHPEASPGPHDLGSLFERFIQHMDAQKRSGLRAMLST